jgi:hypothetical protein
VFVQQQVQLASRRPAHQPIMLFTAHTGSGCRPKCGPGGGRNTAAPHPTDITGPPSRARTDLEAKRTGLSREGSPPHARPLLSRARSRLSGQARGYDVRPPQPGASLPMPAGPSSKRSELPRRSRHAGADRSGLYRRPAPEALARHPSRPPAPIVPPKNPRSTHAKAGGLPRRGINPSAAMLTAWTRTESSGGGGMTAPQVRPRSSAGDWPADQLELASIRAAWGIDADGATGRGRW